MSGSHNPLNPDAVADFLVNRYDDAEDPEAELTDSTDMDKNLAKKIVGAWSKLDVMKRHKMGFKEKDMIAWVNSLAGKHEAKVGRVAELKAVIENDGAAIAKEILSQLGGNKFIAMTGAKNLAHGTDHLTFKIGRNSGGITHVKIKLDKGKDLYDVTFYKIRGTDMKTVKELQGVYAEDLRKIFTETTGLNTSL